MKAEERAILCCLWSGKEAHDITDGSHEPCDFCKHIAQHIREAEQQVRKEALDLLRDIREWDIAQMKKNIIAKGVVRMTLPLPIRQRLQALIEREAG